MAATAMTYEEILGRNISAARGRVQLSQAAVAARMRELGFDWHQQTAGAIEKAKRRVTAGEIFGLAWALETSISALMKPTDDDEFVALPSGQAISAVSVQRSVCDGRAWNDRAVLWIDEQPVFPGPALTAADARAHLESLDPDARLRVERVKAIVQASEYDAGEGGSS
jgi:transcriptional regulator with XRE-family HTH domain